MDSSIISSLIQTISTFLATLIATIPVIVALIFAARQLREAPKQTNQLDHSIKSGIYNDVIGAERQVWQTMLATDPMLLKWWLKEVIGFDDVANDQVNKQNLFILHQLSFYENIYYQHIAGVFPPEAWQVWQHNMRVDLNSECYQAVWDKAGQWYTEGGLQKVC